MKVKFFLVYTLPDFYHCHLLRMCVCVRVLFTLRALLLLGFHKARVRAQLERLARRMRDL